MFLEKRERTIYWSNIPILFIFNFCVFKGTYSTWSMSHYLIKTFDYMRNAPEKSQIATLSKRETRGVSACLHLIKLTFILCLYILKYISSYSLRMAASKIMKMYTLTNCRDHSSYRTGDHPLTCKKVIFWQKINYFMCLNQFNMMNQAKICTKYLR